MLKKGQAQDLYSLTIFSISKASPHLRTRQDKRIGEFEIPTLVFDAPKFVFDAPKFVFDAPKFVFDAPKFVFDAPKFIYDAP